MNYVKGHIHNVLFDEKTKKGRVHFMVKKNKDVRDKIFHFDARDELEAEGKAMLRVLSYAINAWNIDVFYLRTSTADYCEFVWPFHPAKPRRRHHVKIADEIVALHQKHNVTFRCKARDDAPLSRRHPDNKANYESWYETDPLLKGTKPKKTEHKFGTN